MKLLVVEDDANLVSALSRTLGSHYQIDAAQGEREACVQLEISRYHALLIDENLAQGSGLGVIRHVRARNQQTPIIVITSQASKNFAIDCLNLGVNRFLEKPFGLDQLRRELDSFAVQNSEFELAPGWILRADRRRVEREGRDAGLSPLEFRIVEYLVENRGRCVPRQELLRVLWGDSQVSDNTFDTHLYSLSRKAKILRDRIKVSRGRGYWWEQN